MADGIKTYKIVCDCNGANAIIPHDGSRWLFLPEHENETVALLPKDFDPATQEVLIVAKDARRVWVEHAIAGSIYLHTQRPEFTDNCKHQWKSSNESDIHIDAAGQFDEIPQFSVCEFLAVATHRPPEPENPEATVKQFFPYAMWKREGNSFLVYCDQSSRSDIIGRGETLTSAWRSAVESIARHNPGHGPLTPLATKTPPGCYSETVAAPVPSL